MVGRGGKGDELKTRVPVCPMIVPDVPAFVYGRMDMPAGVKTRIFFFSLTGRLRLSQDADQVALSVDFDLPAWFDKQGGVGLDNERGGGQPLAWR